MQLTATLISSTDSHACEEVLCATESGNSFTLHSSLASGDAAGASEQREEFKSTVSAPLVSESEPPPPLPVPRTIRCISPCELDAEPEPAAAPHTSSDAQSSRANVQQQQQRINPPAASESAKPQPTAPAQPLPAWAAVIRHATEPAADVQPPRWQPKANTSGQSPALAAAWSRPGAAAPRVQPQPVLPLREVPSPARAADSHGSRESRIAALQLELITMGFANRELNRRALEAANLDINGAVNWLVDNNDNNWSAARH